MDNQAKNTRIVHLITLIIAVICMALKNSIVIRRFEIAQSGVEHEVLEYTNFFDIAVLKSGHWIPFAAAVITVALVWCVVLSFFLKKSKVLNIVMCVLSIGDILLVLSPIVQFGKEDYTRLAMLISYLLVCATIFSFQHVTGRYFVNPVVDSETE